MRPELKLAVLLGCVAFLGCPRPASNADGGDGSDGGDGDAGVSVARSAKANLRLKSPERLAADVAATLSLPVASVCKELGLYSCTDAVHTVALGGVDPYDHGLYEKLPFTGATTPIAVDRVALIACIQRVTADAADPTQAVIFKNVSLDAQGQLAAPAGPEVAESVRELTRRALLREASAAEVASWVDLTTAAAQAGGPHPGADWMAATCFGIVSSAESVFY